MMMDKTVFVGRSASAGSQNLTARTSAATSPPSLSTSSSSVYSSSGRRADWLAKYQMEVPEGVSNVVSEYLPLPPGYQPSKQDVVCGRGRGYYNCAGNVRFRNLVKSHVELYASQTTKLEKTAVLEEIVKQVKQQSGQSRFVKQIMPGGEWCELGDVATREKVGNAMREALSARNARKVTGLRNLFRSNSDDMMGGGGAGAAAGGGAGGGGSSALSSSLRNVKNALVGGNNNNNNISNRRGGGDIQQHRSFRRARQEQQHQQPLRQSMPQPQPVASQQQQQHGQHLFLLRQQQEQQRSMEDVEMTDIAQPLPNLSSSLGFPCASSSSSSSSSCEVFGKHIAREVESQYKDHSLAMSGMSNNSSSWMMELSTDSNSSFMPAAASTAIAHTTTSSSTTTTTK